MNDSQEMSVELEIKSRCSFYFQAPLTMSALLVCSLLLQRGRMGVVDFQPRADLSIPRHEKVQHSFFFFFKIGS